MAQLNASQSSFTPELSTVIYKAFEIRMAQVFGRYTIEKAQYSMEPFFEHLADEMILKVKIDILGQSNIQTYTVEVDIPAGWWQQLKYDHLPSWVQRFSPMKWKTVTREVTFNHWLLLPKFDKVPVGEEVAMFSYPLNEPGVYNYKNVFSDEKD